MDEIDKKIFKHWNLLPSDLQDMLKLVGYNPRKKTVEPFFQMEKKVEHRLCKVIGDSPRNRVLEFFVNNRNFEFNMSHITSKLKLERIVTFRCVKELIQQKMLCSKLKIGKEPHYRLNTQNHEVKLLIELFDRLENIT